MDKIVHELEGFNTDVFYQVHGIDEKEGDSEGIVRSGYSYLYHCAHCKKKGKIEKELQQSQAGISTISSLPNSIAGMKNPIEDKSNCPNCNAEWKQSQSDERPRSIQKVIFDNGDIMYLYQTIHPRWINAQPVVRQHKLRIKKDTGKMSLTVNDKTTYDVFIISSMLTMYRKYFDDAPTETEYYTSRNHRLKDLLQYMEEGRPEVFFTNIHGNLRRRLYYAYDKHGMKAAYRTVLGNKGNKYLYKLAWQKPELICTLNELINRVDVDSITNIVKCISASHQNFQTLEKLKHVFDLGLSTTKVFNIANTGELELASHWIVQDSARMYSTLLERTNSEYKLPKYRDLANLHELLIRDINQVEDAAAKEVMLPLTNLEEYHASEYSVKIANTAHDLNLLGRVLNICVSGYRHTVLNGNCVIAYVTKGNHMVACLQVTPSSSALVQAKLSHNSPIRTNEEVERVVYSWVKANHLTTATHDVGFTINESSKKIELTPRHEVKEVVNRFNLNIPVFVGPEEDIPF